MYVCATSYVKDFSFTYTRIEAGIKKNGITLQIRDKQKRLLMGDL